MQPGAGGELPLRTMNRTNLVMGRMIGCAAVVVMAMGGAAVARQGDATPAIVPLKKGPPPAATTGTPAATPMMAVHNPPFGMFKDTKFPMIQRSVLTGVPGGITHMGMDLVSNRLYVAAKNKGSLEMLDVSDTKQQPAIEGLPEPQGVLVLSELRKLVVSCGGDNTVRVFALTDKGDATPERTVKFDGEADAIRFDAAAKRVYVGHGHFLGSFSVETGERGPSVKLPGAPEGFVLDPATNKVWVNIASLGQIATLERGEGGEMKITGTVTLKDAKGNYPMAYDPGSGHMIVVCRNPAKLVVIDAKDGTEVASMPVLDDADDCWWDNMLKRVYVSCGGGGGAVEIFQQGKGADGKVSYAKYHQEKTNVGCRTSVWVPEQRRLVVAAPSLGADPTFLYIYFVGP